MKVLLALNDSDVARGAARTAIRMLSASEPELIVLDVAEVPLTWTTGSGRGAAVPLDLDHLTAELEAEEAAAIAPEVDALGVPDPAVEVISGDPATEICRAARRHDVDLVVVGSHRRSFLRRLLEPSIERAVVQEAGCPVLVVPEAGP